jgi:hypothetical protein
MQSNIGKAAQRRGTAKIEMQRIESKKEENGLIN